MKHGRLPNGSIEMAGQPSRGLALSVYARYLIRPVSTLHGFQHSRIVGTVILAQSSRETLYVNPYLLPVRHCDDFIH